ncbi:hypothetical protein GCK72_025376 [Caenorhabditis remanei]|uniref:Uncharacterized protein n=1 Tax=Caenorhabditis remanei TaxID=31234 RepID=A0A6A5G2X8_CAERE|nr:hypothetical protein GCK72_025376 [Caenorhabditis remanei]KAF1748909.1 hypothetical protein GCK72_025376 [Caenorhabditis remanei]
MANVIQGSEQQAPEVQVQIDENPAIQHVEEHLQGQEKQEDELGVANIQIEVLVQDSQNVDNNQVQDRLEQRAPRGGTPPHFDIELPLEYVNGIIRPIPIRPRNHYAEAHGEINFGVFQNAQDLPASPPPTPKPPDYVVTHGEINFETLQHVQNLPVSPPPALNGVGSMFVVPLFQSHPVGQSSNNVTYNFIFPREVIAPMPMPMPFPEQIEERPFEAGHPNWYVGMGIPGWDDILLYSPPPPDPF